MRIQMEWLVLLCAAVIVLAVTAVLITFLWGPRTLARYRYARMGRKLPDNPGVETLGVSDSLNRVV